MAEREFLIDLLNFFELHNIEISFNCDYIFFTSDHRSTIKFETDILTKELIEKLLKTIN